MSVLTVSQVAEQIRMSEDYVRRQAAAGAIRGVKYGNRWRFEESAVKAFLTRNAPPAQPRPERLSARQRRASG